MALNVGDQFKQRWLATPEAVRQTFRDELKHICELLEPDTLIQKWQYQDALLQQKYQQTIKQGYQKLKLEILAEHARLEQERKRKRQAALEKAVANKREHELAELERLEQLEQLKAKAQLDYLHQYAQILEQTSHQTMQHVVKYDVAQARQFNQSNEQERDQLSTSATPYAEDIQTRLELEAEFYIEQTLQQLRVKLQHAAREEIELALVQHQADIERYSQSGEASDLS